jgi:hypothetical protein
LEKTDNKPPYTKSLVFCSPTDPNRLRGNADKAAAAALRGAWGKGASAEVRQALTAAAAHVPAKEDKE